MRHLYLILPFWLSASYSHEADSLLLDPRQDLQLMPYTATMAGENALLRPLFPSDHPSMRPIFTDQHVMKYFGNGQTLTIEQVEERTLASAVHNNFLNKEKKYYHWAIIAHGGIAGRVSIYQPEAYEGITEIFYMISPAYGGRGLTTEAAKLVVNFIGGNFMATAHPDNKGSIAVLEKVGFTRDMHRQNVKLEKYGSVRDYFVFEQKE